MKRLIVSASNNSFEEERKQRISENNKNIDFQNLSAKWVECAMRTDYVYNFDWLGRPIIQFPNDIVAVQELIYKIRPDLIIETGIAHGGSLILSASILALLDLEDAILKGSTINPSESNRKVLGVDIEIRNHNYKAIKKHFLSSRIELLEASSTAASTIETVKAFASRYQSVMVFLDSNHTYKHVIDELNSYAPLVSKESYCVVFDTFVENIPKDVFQHKPWGPSNNPMTAVQDFLQTNNDFKIDSDIESKLMITVAPSGFLKRIH